MGREFLHLPEAAGGGTGALIRHTSFKATNRVGVTSRSRNNYVSVTFTKELGHDESYLLVYGIIPAIGMINWPVIGVYCTIFDSQYSSSTSHGLSSEYDWGYSGIHYGGSGGNSDREQGVHLIEKTFCSNDAPSGKMPHLVRNVPSSFMGAGSKKLEIGANSTSAVRTFTHLNPNSSNDARAHQQATFITIMEFGL